MMDTNSSTRTTPAELPASAADLNKLAKLLFDHIEGQIARADLKAQLIVTGDVIFAALFTAHKGIAIEVIDASKPILDRITSGTLLLTLLSLILSFAFAVATITPNTMSPSETTLAFFGEIAKLPEDKFKTTFKNQSNAEIIDSLLIEIHTKSLIARSKFRSLKWSAYFLILALTMWTIMQATIIIPT